MATMPPSGAAAAAASPGGATGTAIPVPHEGIFPVRKTIDIAGVPAQLRVTGQAFRKAMMIKFYKIASYCVPKYRGAAPVNWAIVNGETETGVTTMQMDVGLDTGDILMQRATAIGADENAIGLMERLSAIGAELLSKTLTDLDNLKPIKQDKSAATFAPIMKREDGLIDWKMSAGEIANRVRGFNRFRQPLILSIKQNLRSGRRHLLKRPAMPCQVRS